jgi:hypothetical protein
MSTSGTWEVVWPLGKRRVEDIQPNEVSEARTVGFIWDYLMRGDEMWDVLKVELHAHDPAMKLVDWDTFGNVHGHDEAVVLAALPERIRAAELDSVIVGTGA